MSRLLLTFFFLGIVLARRPPPAPVSHQVAAPAQSPLPSGSPSSVIGRTPGQLGESTYRIVSSIGHEVGDGVGTVASGVGEIPRALGKATGSIPEAIGEGFGHLGDAGIDEVRNIAESIGDTVRGLPGVASGIIGGVLNGSNRTKRNTLPLQNLSLLDHVNLLRASASEASDSALRQVCKLISLLHIVAENEQLSELAPRLTPHVRELLTTAQGTLCSAVNVTGDVENLIDKVLGQ